MGEDGAMHTVFIGSWNVNGKTLGNTCLKGWLAGNRTPPDIYAVGLQELSREVQVEQGWVGAVEQSLHPGIKYIKVKVTRVEGTMLIVFSKENFLGFISNSDVCYLGKKVGGGAVAVRFDLNGRSFCFVNCHLTPHTHQMQKRNELYNLIMSECTFNLTNGSRKIDNHDRVFWFGDLNYRINPEGVNREDSIQLIADGKYLDVLQFDQLKDQMNAVVVLQGFKEGPIIFPPTYKYDPGTDNWDSSQRNRSPAWCDRILWKGSGILQVNYNSSPDYKISDHKPISSFFAVDTTNQCVP